MPLHRVQTNERILMRYVGLAAFAGFIFTIFAANWLIDTTASSASASG
jgi:hypothetical protein